VWQGYSAGIAPYKKKLDLAFILGLRCLLLGEIDEFSGWSDFLALNCDGAEDQNPNRFAGYMQELIDG
jgi:hypothetical protein